MQRIANTRRSVRTSSRAPALPSCGLHGRANGALKSNSGSDAMDTDVLIVGAGPTGLMLANQLARRGVRAMIIDRHAGPARETRALGVQARTLEIYSQLGIAKRAVEMGKRGTGGYIWARGRKMAHVPFGEAGKDVTPYPYILVL